MIRLCRWLRLPRTEVRVALPQCTRAHARSHPGSGSLPPCRSTTANGVRGANLPCRLSRVRRGGPASIRGDCQECDERRCRAHCKRGRDGTAHGRARSRGAITLAPSGTSSESEDEAPLGPIGRPAKTLELKVYGSDDAFWCCLRKGIKSAWEVLLGTYMLDEPSLQILFLMRLAGQYEFSLDVFVEKEMFDVRSARFQRPRLEALRRAGARIWLCDGARGLGPMHMKALCVDRRLVFIGSGNFTNKSHDNPELRMHVKGPAATKIYAMCHGLKLQGQLLDAEYYRGH